MARETRATSNRRAKRHNPAAGRITRSPPSPAKPSPSSTLNRPSNHSDLTTTNHASSSSSSAATAAPIQQTAAETEPPTIDDDDLCPICHLLLYQPVLTTCNHALCRSCMSRWADISTTSGQMTIVPLSDAVPPPEPDAATTDPLLLADEARCPMCRTPTRAVRDARREEVLRARAMTVFVGNTHELLEVREGNCHEWTFFVRPGDVDVVEEVQILLHPTFRPPRVIRAMPPYQITRIGWGYFTVQAYIILKAGYTWISEDAQPTPDGVEKGMLPLEWMLSFDGNGSMGRCRLKYKHEISVEGSDSSYDDDSEYEE
ncbi:putative yeats family protein [Lasiodiplodia theobromae]|nr:putative yeats family protein [Lasiodiplodia theobromae]